MSTDGGEPSVEGREPQRSVCPVLQKKWQSALLSLTKGGRSAVEMNGRDSIMRQQMEGTIHLQRTWPQLGRSLYSLESEMIAACSGLDEGQKNEVREKLRVAIREKCGEYEKQYEAYELVRAGRAVEIVGNPHYLGRDGKEYELPYTGLEGYYAGSEARSARPGMTKEQIVEEEANVGLQLLREMKKHYIEHDSWCSFTRLQRAAEGGEANVADLRNLDLLWTKVVRRLRERVYENEEARGTPLEQFEVLMSKDPKLAQDSLLREEYARLLEEEGKMSREERAEARAGKRTRETIFRSRLEEFTRFRDETYSRLKDPCGRVRHIDYQIEDGSFADSNIVETLSLPQPDARSCFPPYLVQLTPEQLEGYSFLAQLGERGGDPLIRGILSILNEHVMCL